MINIDTLLSAILVAIPTSLITVHLAIRKYRTEKWWDRKAECYIETVKAINDIISACDNFLIEETEGVLVEENHRQEIINKYKAGKLLIETQTNIGQLLMTNDAYSELLTLDNLLYREEDAEDLIRRLGTIRVGAEECLSRFIPLAKKDLCV